LAKHFSVIKIFRVARAGGFTILCLLILFNLAGCSSRVNTLPTIGATEQEKIVKSFLQSINDKDAQKVVELLGTNMVYIEKYSDGTQDKFTLKKDIQDRINTVIGNDTIMTVDEFQHPNTTTLVAIGKASDFVTKIGGFPQGLDYTCKYTFNNGKISSMELQRNKTDEDVLQEKTKGTIGIVLTEDDEEFVIEQCLNGKPAEKAGLKAGDRIEAVDGLKVADMKHGMVEATYRIRGEVGTQVELTVNRDGKVFNVNVSRTE